MTYRYGDILGGRFIRLYKDRGNGLGGNDDQQELGRKG